MQQPKPPVPVPRTHFYCPVKTDEDEPENYNSTPHSPPTSPQSSLSRSVPPPVPPKKVSVKKRPGGSETGVDIVEIVKTVVKQPSKDDFMSVEQKPEFEHDYETLDDDFLSDCSNKFRPWKSLNKDLKEKQEKDAQIISIKVKAEQIYEAVQVYIRKMSECGQTLKQHIYELRCVADNLDKVSKGTKIAGITGGATTVAGGVAAAAGVILSPFTLGASLALTAVGVGVAAAGGVTGASAAIANKVNVTQDKKKIDKTLNDYEKLTVEIQACLKFINDGMDQLMKDGPTALRDVRMDSVRFTQVVQLVASGGANASALEANSKAFASRGLIQGFALGMDFFFVQGKDGQKVKKGLESKFAKKIRRLADDLDAGLDELFKIKDVFSEHCSE